MASNTVDPKTELGIEVQVRSDPLESDNSEKEERTGEEEVPRSRWRRFVGYFWDTLDGPPRDRRYVQKLDTFMFSYICLGYFIKDLSQTNISNAFVSGMKEDLALYGNERNLLETWFNVGIIIGTVPAQMIQLKWLRPSIYIPACEAFWTVLVMCMAAAKDVKTLYILRFFVGLAEACAFPGYAALLGGWYGPTELSKRTAIFAQTSGIASMFSGYLQAALYTGMNGRLGLKGWQWLFIFDGVISLPIAIWGFFAIPDLPHTTRAFYWRGDDKQYGIERAEKIGRKPPQKLTLAIIRKVYTNWRLWVFILPYLMVALASKGKSYFNLYLKADGYSVVQTNILPTAGEALSIVAAFAFGIAVDSTGQRLWFSILIQAIVMVSNIILSIWHLPKSALLAAFYMSFVGLAAQPIIIAWGQHLNAGDPNLRQLLVATGNIFTYTCNAWIPLVLFPTYDAPKYDYGYQIQILFGGLAITGAVLLQYLHKRFD